MCGMQHRQCAQYIQVGLADAQIAHVSSIMQSAVSCIQGGGSLCLKTNCIASLGRRAQLAGELNDIQTDIKEPSFMKSVDNAIEDDMHHTSWY